MVKRFKAAFGNGQDQGFTLIELLIVILIVGILAAVATPLYLGYIKDAKTAEAKAVVGSLWTAVQSNAIGTCGTDSKVKDGFPKAGLDADGKTVPVRWSVSAGSTATLTVDCTSGGYTASAADLFTIKGDTADVDFIRVKLNYDSTGTPPSKLLCNTNGGTGDFVPC
ncbi:MAG TPA: prepilin-type N-terminal cleavage/methylation domain-containing protein [Methylomirabilota bacterium]|jgi:type IV pilus assembly protein PilA|nr:prepilin-type N-terminal cleavage/methylation domain-containing protein [Methylomirabilota bacterium]